ncbi:hypothetical protein SH579_07995 [Raoultella ornithinolytica]|uniref:hypothetical protein n=1 Tax=Raoultella ornithinolytica TaxID=54291 RepID=UPI002A5A8877|nr:hypothetical protein [Raoultella ornithinolytica]WPO20852.1 hypothetical protein SH579_07995 [Raoultella ornithinolytica]
MPFYLTGNPVPSASVLDIRDNSQNLDLALNDITSSLWADRLGRNRMTWFGLESAFTVKLSDFESRFSTQIVEQEATFDASQVDKENRFQAFLDSSGYVFLGDYEDGPFQFSARNQYIRYDNQYYRLDANTDVGFTTTGTDATSFANDVTHFVLMDGDTLRQNLGSNELPGLSMIGLAVSGRLSDAIVSAYVSAFGGDKSGQEDSTAAVLKAVAAIRTVVDSRYVPGSKRFGRVIFGNGQYIVGDVPIFSGIAYEGQGRWQTLIIPKAGCSFAFTTTGTTSEPPVVSSKRCLHTTLCGMTIGYGYQEQLYTPVPDAGGVNWSDVSYGIMRDVFFHDLHGYGIKLDFVWDSDFENIRIDNCGHVTRDSEGNITEVREGLNIGPGGSANDGSNALRFRGLHIEDCPKLLHIGDRSRHIFFTSPKLEGTNNIAASSTIRSTVGVTFDCPELTWQSSAIPMFDAYGLTQTVDNYNLVFDSPTLISSLTTPGWYFKYSSYLAPLILNNPTMRGVARLAEGDNIQITGGSSHQSGPCLVKGTGRVIIEGVNWQNILASVAGDGSDDVIVLSGYGNRVNGNTFKPQGSATDGSACINLTSTANNSEAIGNNFYGSKNYGLRIGNPALYKTVYDNRIYSFAASTFGSLITGIAQRFTVTSALEDNPLGVTGSLLAGSITISNGGTGQVSCFRGATTVNLRAILGGSRLSVARCFGDSGLNNSMVLSDTLSSHGNIMKTGSGSAGDGFIYVNQDYARMTITNYSGQDVTLYWSSITPYNV